MSRIVFMVGMLLGACAPATATLDVPAPDAQQFSSKVYPLLLRDCGFPACHGSTERFFRVFGPGRTRLRFEEQEFPLDPATPEEVYNSYTRARSMLAHEGNVLESLLLRKPLSKAAGGAGHAGDDNWGGNVYETELDPAYVTLKQWALSATPGAVP